jgi:2-methylisocitrate lyase-like PEP mutase family enzyme
LNPIASLIQEARPLVVPSVYDAMSALLVRDLGFRAAYIGSYATTATMYGLPDVGHIGLEEMADQVRRLAPVASVPIIVDGEGGWGNQLHVARAVRVLEQAGAAAVHIEDTAFGKHIVRSIPVIPVGLATDKIKAAVDARASADFMIIARTDAAWSEGPVSAVDRLLAYKEAGADGLFVTGLDPTSWARLRAEAGVPIVTVDFPDRSAADHAHEGADVVLYYALTHLAAVQGMRAALETLARNGSTTSIADDLGSITDFDAFLGIEEVRAKARQYGLLS